MAKTNPSLGNQEIELVSPVKILVKPSISDDDGTANHSVRRRSAAQVVEVASSGPSRENEQVFLVDNQLIGQGREDRDKQAVFQITSDGTVERKNAAYYLKHCFRLMYFGGMSTYNPENTDDGEKTWFTFVLTSVQQVAFWTVTTLSILYALLSLKFNAIIFLEYRGLLLSIYVGSWLFTFFAELYFIYLFGWRHTKIAETTEALSRLGCYTIDQIGRKNWKCRNPRKMITVLFISSLFVSSMQPMGGNGIEGWSTKKLVLSSSTKLAIRVFIWKQGDFANQTQRIDQDYGMEITPGTLFLGIINICMRVSSNIKMDTALNLSVVIAVIVLIRNRKFAKKLKHIDFNTYTDGNDASELDSPTGHFAEFKRVKKEDMLLNELVGGLLKITHAFNFLLCTSFIVRCFYNEGTLTEFAYLLYNLVKVVIIYYFGQKAEAENEVYQQWIRNWSMHSKDLVFLGRVPAILDEMEKVPSGLGRGNFLVGQGLIFRFLGFVGSIFMLEVDDDDDEE